MLRELHVDSIGYRLSLTLSMIILCSILASSQTYIKHTEGWFKTSVCKSDIICLCEQRILAPDEARTHNLGMSWNRLRYVSTIAARQAH